LGKRGISPQLQENVPVNPFLKAIVGCRARTQIGLIQRFPLAACPHYIKDPICALPVRDSRPPTSKPMGVYMDWQNGLQLCPQLVGDAKSRCGFVIRRPCSCPLLFGRLCFFRHLHSLPVIRIGSKWVHGKRRIVEPERALSPLEAEERVCAALSCSAEDHLFISENVS